MAGCDIVDLPWLEMWRATWVVPGVEVLRSSSCCLEEAEWCDALDVEVHSSVDCMLLLLAIMLKCYLSRSVREARFEGLPFICTPLLKQPPHGGMRWA